MVMQFIKIHRITFDGSMYSLGIRSQRFAMVLTGLKVEKLFVEKPGYLMFSAKSFS